MQRLLPALLVLVGCSPDGAGDTAQTTAWQVPAPPEGGMQMMTPAFDVPAFSEKQVCYFGTYDGPDVGLHASESFQSEFGHHVVLLGTNFTEAEFADGELVDCTDEADFDMLRVDPLFIEGNYDPAFPDGSSLPEGMALELKAGQRWILQAHYINPSDETITRQDAINLALLDADEVDIWAATWAHSTISIDVPPGGTASKVIECTFEEELELLNLFGHMHQWGSAFQVDLLRDDTTQTIYEVADWAPEHRDDSPVEDFDGGTFSVGPGDTFRTTCSWFNDTESSLGFPEEMCATVGVLYPRREALTCVDF